MGSEVNETPDRVHHVNSGQRYCAGSAGHGRGPGSVLGPCGSQLAADLEAEGVVQDGLIKAWKKIGGLREPAAFSSWLTRIVANTAVARARSRRIFQPLNGAEFAARDRSVDDRIDVQRLLTKLAPRQRAVLHLTVVEGLSDSEIAEVLGISSSSVRVHRMRGRQHMERLVGRGEN